MKAIAERAAKKKRLMKKSQGNGKGNQLYHEMLEMIVKA